MREMKDSGIEWIGDAPAAWRVYRGKDVLIQLSRKTKDDDGIITCFRDGEVTLRSNRREDGFTIAEKEFGYQGIEPGDLVVHGMDGFAGSIGVSDSRGKASPVLNVLDSDEDKRFLMYCLRGLAYRDVYMAMATGIRVRSCNLNWKKLAELPLVIPNYKEQLEISSFLDRKCAEIDEAIEAAEASIEEYKLYKKSVIFQTVTKGLNHNVPMKDSGIEHLDSIPAHWAVRPVKSLMSFSKGINILKTDLCDEGEPCVTYGEAHGRLTFSFDADRDYIRRAPLRFTVGGEKSIVYTGDFIFADTSEDIAGSGDFTFNAGKKPVFAGYHSVVARNIFPDQFDSLFLAFLFDSLPFRYQIQKRVGGVKVYSINARNIGSALAWIPPIEEQIEISRYLEQVRSNLDIAIQTKSQIIEELKAYKKSLIWETATGKREVPCL